MMVTMQKLEQVQGLIAAIRAKDPAHVNEHLTMLSPHDLNIGVYVSAVGSGYQHFITPLVAAVCIDRPDILSKVIQAGADVNFDGNSDGVFAIRQAALRGNAEALKMLLRNGSNVNQQTKPTFSVGSLEKVAVKPENVGVNALIVAARRGHQEIIAILIAAGADVNATTQNGDSASIYAARNGHSVALEMLLNAGARLNRQFPNFPGYWELHLAAKHGHVGVIGVLVRHPCVTAQDAARALLDAAMFGQAAVVQSMIQGGINPNVENLHCRTVLMEAVVAESPEAVALIVNSGVDVNYQSQSTGWTALMWAATMSSVQARSIVELLLNAKASMNLRCKEGNTALMHAAAAGRRALATLLLQYGADQRTVNAKGQNAFELALVDNHTATAAIFSCASAKAATTPPAKRQCTSSIATIASRTVLPQLGAYISSSYVTEYGAARHPPLPATATVPERTGYVRNAAAQSVVAASAASSGSVNTSLDGSGGAGGSRSGSSGNSTNNGSCDGRSVSDSGSSAAVDALRNALEAAQGQWPVDALETLEQCRTLAQGAYRQLPAQREALQRRAQLQEQYAAADLEACDFHLIAQLGLAIQRVDRELGGLGWSTRSDQMLENRRVQLVGNLRSVCAKLVSSKSFQLLLAVANVLECIENLPGTISRCVV